MGPHKLKRWKMEATSMSINGNPHKSTECTHKIKSAIAPLTIILGQRSFANNTSWELEDPGRWFRSKSGWEKKDTGQNVGLLLQSRWQWCSGLERWLTGLVYPAEDGTLIPIITSGILKSPTIPPPEHLTPSSGNRTHPSHTHTCVCMHACPHTHTHTCMHK